MSLVLYNSLTRTKAPFEPVEEGKAKIYVCGPTVYDDSHIGHARAVVVFDVLVRHLKDLGYEVTYVRNFTDVDDKIINRSNERGEDYLTLAERYIESFREDMDALGTLRPDHEPRATQYIEHMKAAVEELLKKGHAYKVDGDIYFDVASYRDYGLLSGRNLDEMRSGVRIQINRDKKNPWDFALWKAGKPGEPSWPTDWGAEGRPGWHTECLVMSHELLGSEFDIHGGGLDLIFPHHENEMAQAGALGRKFARIWMHNGFVRVNNEKMSKSLKNFFTVKEVLAKFDPEVVRLFLISKHYRSPIDFSDDAIEETARSLDRAYRALQLANLHISDVNQPIEDRETKDIFTAFQEALNDDLNTAKAIGHVFELVRKLYKMFEQQVGSADPGNALFVKNTILTMGHTLGILTKDPDEFFSQKAEAALSDSALTPEKIEALIQQRAEARKAKNFAESDRIRDELKSQGVILEDAGGETRWRMEG